MYDQFNKLKTIKKRTIINAAIQEFVKNGFDHASTNEIVKKANISKGSLFNYFKSKKDLYVYLVDHCVQVIEAFYNDIDLNERDLFKRIENIGYQKLSIQKKSPHVFDFLASAVQEDSNEVKELIDEKVGPIYGRGFEHIYDNIDDSKFREGLDIEKAVEILTWTMFGFAEKGIFEMDTFKNSNEFGEQYFKQWQKYAEILKKSFYK